MTTIRRAKYQAKRNFLQRKPCCGGTTKQADQPIRNFTGRHGRPRRHQYQNLDEIGRQAENLNRTTATMPRLPIFVGRCCSAPPRGSSGLRPRPKDLSGCASTPGGLHRGWPRPPIGSWCVTLVSKVCGLDLLNLTQNYGTGPSSGSRCIEKNQMNQSFRVNYQAGEIHVDADLDSPARRWKMTFLIRETGRGSTLAAQAATEGARI